MDGPGYEALAERLENLGVLDWQIWAGELTAVTDVIAERPDATVGMARSGCWTVRLWWDVSAERVRRSSEATSVGVVMGIRAVRVG